MKAARPARISGARTSPTSSSTRMIIRGNNFVEHTLYEVIRSGRAVPATRIDREEQHLAFRAGHESPLLVRRHDTRVV